MSQALLPLFPDFIPSRLQEAAISRIRAYEKELRDVYHLNFRSSMELEFTITDKDGNLIPGLINLPAAEDWLKNHSGLPHIQRLEPEGRIGKGQRKPQSASQYEVNIDDSTLLDTRYLPEEIAAVTHRLKTQTLQQMLHTSTCLTSDAGNVIARGFHPNFSAAPAAKMSCLSPDYVDDTSALHINTSLFDNAGVNITARYPHLLGHCAESMLALQNEAGLSMLPSALPPAYRRQPLRPPRSRHPHQPQFQK